MREEPLPPHFAKERHRALCFFWLCWTLTGSLRSQPAGVLVLARSQLQGGQKAYSQQTSPVVTLSPYPAFSATLGLFSCYLSVSFATNSRKHKNQAKRQSSHRAQGERQLISRQGLQRKSLQGSAQASCITSVAWPALLLRLVETSPPSDPSRCDLLSAVSHTENTDAELRSLGPSPASP